MTDTATAPSESGTGSRDFCTALVGPLLIGIGVEAVREVFSRERFTPVPRVGGCVSGLINLRGQIIAAIDLRCRFGVAPGVIDETIHIVVDYRHEPVSLIVDDVRDVVTVSDQSFEPHPETVDFSTRQLVSGAYKLPDGLLLPIDTDLTIASSSNASERSEE